MCRVCVCVAMFAHVSAENKDDMEDHVNIGHAEEEESGIFYAPFYNY